MTKKRWLIMATIIFILTLFFLIWISWFPKPKEPGFVFIQQWGEKGNMPGKFNKPIGIAITDYRVYVSDAGNNRIQVFDTSGVFLFQFGREGNAPGEFSRPMHIFVRDSSLYVADYLNDRIQVFTLQGNFIRSIGKSGESNAEFDAPVR